APTPPPPGSGRLCSAAGLSTSRPSSPADVTSRSSSSPIITVTLSILASASARCSAAARSSWRRHPRPPCTSPSGRRWLAPRSAWPASRRLSAFASPSGPGVRVDAGIAPGSTVSVHYDPMLGKVIVWDHDRPHAIARMLRALGELRVEGVRTTRDVLLKVIDSPEFRAGRLHTRLLEDVLVPRLKGT